MSALRNRFCKGKLKKSVRFAFLPILFQKIQRSSAKLVEASMSHDNPEGSQIYDYYVYELRDPRNNETFYVGMGQGSRVDFHGNDKKAPEHPKELRISDIKNDGYADCIRVIIGSYETAEEAFAVEATLINWIYGHDMLSNINPGRHSWCIRPAKQHRDKLRATASDFPEMEGIDRPKPVRTNDGSYTRNQLQAIEANKISQKLEWLTAELMRRKSEGSEELQGVEVIGPKLDRSQDPELVISIDGTPVNAHLKLQLTGELVSFNLRPKDNRRDSHNKFVQHVTSNIIEPYDLTTRSGGIRNYVKAEPRGSKYCNILYGDIDTILMVLRRAQMRLTCLKAGDAQVAKRE